VHPALFGTSEGNRNLIVALNGFLATVITGDVDRTRCEDQRSCTAPASARGSPPIPGSLIRKYSDFRIDANCCVKRLILKESEAQTTAARNPAPLVSPSHPKATWLPSGEKLGEIS
jgi:hypothetical protein